jgi:exopolysaccharide production protein ExoZ
MNKINSIQFLRAFAALLVAYHHSIQCQMEFSKSAQQSFFHLWNFGTIGVDIFFVVSGFIISYANASNSGAMQATNFLIKRFIRINPAYYIASMMLMIVLIVKVWTTEGISDVSLDKLANSFADTVLIIPAFEAIQEYMPFIIAGWTLGFEWFFYFLFFLLIVFKVKNKALLLSAIILLLVTIGQLFRPTGYQIVFSTNSILLEFILGIVIYTWYAKAKIVSTSVSLGLLLIGIIGFICLIIFGFGYVWSYSMVLMNKLSLERFLLFGIPSAAIVAGCLFLEKALKLQWLWNSKLTNILGDASYSIYLVNPIVFALLTILYKKVGFFLPPDVAIIIQLIVAIIISIAFFRAIEKPFINQSKSIKLDKNQFRPIPKNVVGT